MSHAGHCRAAWSAGRKRPHGGDRRCQRRLRGRIESERTMTVVRRRAAVGYFGLLAAVIVFVGVATDRISLLLIVLADLGSLRSARAGWPIAAHWSTGCH